MSSPSGVHQLHHQRGASPVAAAVARDGGAVVRRAGARVHVAGGTCSSPPRQPDTHQEAHRHGVSRPVATSGDQVGTERYIIKILLRLDVE